MTYLKNVSYLYAKQSLRIVCKKCPTSLNIFNLCWIFFQEDFIVDFDIYQPVNIPDFDSNVEHVVRQNSSENDEGTLQMVMKLFLFIYTIFSNGGVYKMCTTYVCKCIILFTLSRMALAKSNVRKLDCMMKL
jgi:hypothetical protein